MSIVICSIVFFRQREDNDCFGRRDEIIVLADRHGFWPRYRSSAFSSRGICTFCTLISYARGAARPTTGGDSTLRINVVSYVFSSGWPTFKTFMQPALGSRLSALNFYDSSHGDFKMCITWNFCENFPSLNNNIYNSILSSSFYFIF